MPSAIPATPIALTIAGSDSSGGAGIQADLKTFAALGVYGASVITAVTAQNTRGVRAVEVLSPGIVAAQIAAVLDDLAIGAIKTGMLANEPLIEAVVAALAGTTAPLVVDPVMVATSGDRLLDPAAVDAVRTRLAPLAVLLTPNLPEAAVLTGLPIAADEAAMRAQAERLLRLGCRAVLIKGGHGTSSEAVDLLLDGDRLTRLARPRLATRNTHGTGCTLSAAIAARLARGDDLGTAVAAAKAYLWDALAHADALRIGHGSGPVHHGYASWPTVG